MQTRPDESRPRQLQLRGVMWCAVLLLQGVAVPAQSAGFDSGSFTKSTAAAPVSQVVSHGLGQAPRALILWTVGNTDESFSADFHHAIGFSNGTNDRSASAASNDVSPTNASRRFADKALTIVEWGETVLAEADLASWDANGFTLDWTTNDANAYVIHYLAIGGSEVTAEVVDWTTATSTGNQSIGGIGFEPDAVLHAYVGGFTASIPNSVVHAGIGLAVMTAAGDQWAHETFITDEEVASRTQRGQQTDACFLIISNGVLVTREASFVSMDPDGFTINWSATNAPSIVAISLALEGVRVHAGSFDKSTAAAPASQSVTGLGFEPGALLLASVQSPTMTDPVVQGRYGFGATDGTTEGSIAIQDDDADNPASVDAIDKTSKVFVKVDNQTPAIDAEADLTSFDADGFTLDWTTNDAVATEILYFGLATEDRRVMVVQ